MRITFILATFLTIIAVSSCSKTTNGLSTVVLTPSASTVAAGETVSVTLTSGANASRWTVTPSLDSKATYTVTTSKVNYFTFTKPGVYKIGVSTKNVVYDSTANQSLDSCWLHAGGGHGCVKGIDSASAKITVTN